MKGYLVLTDRLSQVWLNGVTISSSILVIKIAIFCYVISHFLSLSEVFLLTGCDNLDRTLNSIDDQIPQYLSTVGNYMVKKSMQESIETSITVISLLITASEEILAFFIELYLGTYACLVVSTIDGTVDVAANTTEHIIGFVNETMSDMANTLDDGLNGLSTVINKVISAANKIEGALRGNPTSLNDDFHKVNLTSDKLRHFSIPPTIDYKLQRLSERVPNFDQLKNETKKLINIPFENIRERLLQLNSLDLLPSDAVLPKPIISDNERFTSGVCSKSIPDIKEIYGTLRLILRTATIVVIVLGTIAVLSSILPHVYSEYKLWKRLNQMQGKLDSYLDEKYISLSEDDTTFDSRSNRRYNENSKFDLIECYCSIFEFWPTKVSALLTKYKKPDSSGKIKYLTQFILSQRARNVLLLAIMGIISCGIQFALLHAVDRSVDKSLKSLTQEDPFHLESVIKSGGAYVTVWSESANSYISDTELNINTEFFGWVQNTTSTINSTVAITMDKIDTTLGDIFNGTLLYGPMKTVANCAIERKLAAVQRAMLWVNKHARVTLPRVNSTEISKTLSKNSQKVHSPLSPLEVGTYVKRVTTIARNSTFYELYVSLALLLIWLLQIPTALLLSARR
ncbi:hypothetical protein RNJ44_00893 [Nakaseomyces bracarensis]|uniref:Plasma membrane fusion protein PRM1 n=1 Tax=Nakaseomyces bracarensis TaxID=273131 RepID=A0ABR4NQD4_9SACH